jgi:hypothetical protein
MKPINVLIGAGVFLLSCGLAAANTCGLNTCVTFSGFTPITELDFFGDAVLGLPLPQEEIILPMFDTTLGTLQSATVSITAQSGVNNDNISANGVPPGSALIGDASQFFINDAAQGTPTSFTQQVSFQMYLMDGAADQTACLHAITTAGSEGTASCLVAGAVDGALGTNSTMSFANTQSASAGETFITPLSLGMTTSANITSLIGDFEAHGGGNITLPVYAESESMITNNTGNGTDKLSLFAGMSASITYAYTPATSSSSGSAPEPTTFLLMGAALISLGLLRKRSLSNARMALAKTR